MSKYKQNLITLRELFSLNNLDECIPVECNIDSKKLLLQLYHIDPKNQKSFNKNNLLLDKFVHYRKKNERNSPTISSPFYNFSDDEIKECIFI